MSPKKAENKPQKNVTEPVTAENKAPNWLDYFRFGESYTSLILGIIVVIITTILLVFLVKDRSSTPLNDNRSISSASTSLVTPTEVVLPSGATFALSPEPTTRITMTPMKVSVSPTKTTVRALTVTPQPSVTKIPTRVMTPTTVVSPTRVVTVTKMVTPTKVIAQNTKPTTSPNTVTSGKTYTVVKGDSLWSIAEKFYRSGYNWVDIASANKLSNPGVISAGTKLTIPDVKAKVVTVQTTSQIQNETYGPKITGNTYKVQKGDHLWGIAVRAYNNGYQWSQIAKVNNITNPSVIHVGTVLKIPRVAAAATPAIK